MPFCSKCGNKVDDHASFCVQCGGSIANVPSTDLDDNATMRMLIPFGRSKWAIIAGYLGLISILIFPAPFALLTGAIALRDIRKHPEKHGKGRAIFGVVMGLLFTVLLMAIMFLPWV